MKKNPYMDKRTATNLIEAQQKALLKQIVKTSNDDQLYFLFEETIKEMNLRKENKDG